MSPILIASIILIVALATWMLMMPYGRCLAGQWKTGSVPVTIVRTGMYTAVVHGAPGTATLAIKIKPMTRSVELTQLAHGNESGLLIASGEVAYGKNTIKWIVPPELPNAGHPIATWTRIKSAK